MEIKTSFTFIHNGITYAAIRNGLGVWKVGEWAYLNLDDLVEDFPGLEEVTPL